MRYGGTSHEDHRWKLSEDFIINFNEYCTHIISPLDIIFSDESILRWYIQGGHWIHLSFPVYVTMDRKPENGAEIHNSSFWWSGIMMQIRIFKSSSNDADQ